MKRFFVFLILALQLAAQNPVIRQGNSPAGAVDFSEAAATKPLRIGTAPSVRLHGWRIVLSNGHRRFRVHQRSIRLRGQRGHVGQHFRQPYGTDRSFKCAESAAASGNHWDSQSVHTWRWEPGDVPNVVSRASACCDARETGLRSGRDRLDADCQRASRACDSGSVGGARRIQAPTDC